jgi:transcriptional regulator with XRE-family HTH domain
MDRAEEEDVLRITAEYVAEVQAGHVPRLSDYLEHYPQYADAIAEFVAYYHAVEADLPGEAVAPRLSEGSSRAMERAWGRVSEFSNDRGSTGQITSLLAIANRRHLSLNELAVKTGLSRDIIEKLERGIIVASTLPQELLRRFAMLLQEPFTPGQAQGQAQGTVPTGLSGRLGGGVHANEGASPGRMRVAESGSSYQMEEQTDLRVQSFREAVEQSAQLSDEQKGMWRDILSREGL